MTLTATDAELERLERAVGTHLSRFGQKDGLAVAWTREDGACGPAEGRRRAGRGLPGPIAGMPLHLTGAGPASRGSSRPVRWCCTLEGDFPANRLGVFRVIPGSF